jgi:site-specific recombinase XerD
MEGIGLDTQDLNIDLGLMRVRKAKFKQVRMVPVSRVILEDIQKYRKRYRDPLLKKLGKTKENALLISKSGDRLSGK